MVTQEDVIQTLAETDVSTPLTSLKADVPLVSQGLDSLDLATLMLALESKYKKIIPPEQAARLKTVGEIVDFLNA
jgi:acyl carrier protein